MTWENIDAYLRACGIHIDTPTLGQTTGGSHVPGSLHYQARARDYDLDNDCVTIAEALEPWAKGSGYTIEELFFQSGDTGWFFDHGREFTPSVGLREGHRNHLHAGLAEGRHLPTGEFMALTDDEQHRILRAADAVLRWDNPPGSPGQPKGGILVQIRELLKRHRDDQ